MYFGDRSRKETLVRHGFRLPSALDNRPLKENEFWRRVPQCIFVSATPGDWEIEQSAASLRHVTSKDSPASPLSASASTPMGSSAFRAKGLGLRVSSSHAHIQT
jgi:hypothetical protein